MLIVAASLLLATCTFVTEKKNEPIATAWLPVLVVATVPYHEYEYDYCTAPPSSDVLVQHRHHTFTLLYEYEYGTGRVKTRKDYRENVL